MHALRRGIANRRPATGSNAAAAACAELAYSPWPLEAAFVASATAPNEAAAASRKSRRVGTAVGSKRRSLFTVAFSVIEHGGGTPEL
jgi:hypothetical protein